MSDSVLDDQDCATAAIDSSTRLVTAYSRQDSLLQQSKEKEIQLAARRRARHIVEHWDEMEEEPEERRGRLEGRIQQLSKEKRSILQRQTIASVAVRALDLSHLTNSLSPSPDPSPRQLALQQLVNERDSLSFSLLKLSKDKSEITSRSTQLRKKLMRLNRQNLAMATSIREQAAASADPTSLADNGSAPSSSVSSTLHELQRDELILTTSRLKVVSFVLQSLIHESGILSHRESRSSQTRTDTASTPTDPVPERPEHGMLRLFLLAGEDWDEFE